MHRSDTTALNPESDRSVPSLAARAIAFLATIRGRILIAFLLMSIITGALGIYAAIGMGRAGVLVSKTFDESLMSINYARAASANFAAMRAAFTRRWITADPGMRAKLDREVDTLEQSLVDDLAIAAKRSQSLRAARAAANVQNAVWDWNGGRLRLLAGEEAEISWDTLDRYAAIVDQQIDFLINYTAGDGFTYRQSARAAVASDTTLNLVATALALSISALVAWLLARRITGPVGAASNAAELIADGKLDVEIPRGGADELGKLLVAMRRMRDNIKVMMEREVELRRFAQTRLADALESSREGVVVADADGRLALANAQAADFLGIAPESLRPGMPITDIAAFTAKSAYGRTIQSIDLNSVNTSEVRLADGRWLRISRSATREQGFIVVCS